MEVKVKTKNSYNVKLTDINNHQIEDNYFICIDKRVLQLQKKKLQKILANAQDIIVVESLEKNKSQETITNILNMLNKNEATRSSTLIGIGGGIIGDLTGYASAIYMRGINFIQVPTTLLSQVDSSIGNKVGINAFGTKNAIGTFYAPKEVIIDVEFLDTLTTRLFKEGFVELIKHGFINDINILHTLDKFANIDELRKAKKELKELIRASLKVKNEIVQIDPLDKHERHCLNYGHTFAHALELSTENLYHGESVAIGMLVSAKLSNNKNIYLKTREILEKFECLRPLENVDFTKMKHDKKRSGTTIKEVILNELGNYEIKVFDLNSLVTQFEKIYSELKNEDLKVISSNYVIKANKLKGEVHIPPSKSYAHRYLIASLLADTPVVLHGFSEISNDVAVSINAIKALGCEVIHEDNKLYISQNKRNLKNISINMKESGTSLRLLMPLLMHFSKEVLIDGENKLPTRPMQAYLDIFEMQKISYSYVGENYLPIKINGSLRADNFSLSGNVSSQFLSGLLFTLPLLDEDSTITLTSKLESLPYVLMTLNVLKDFGIKIKHNEDYSFFEVKGMQNYVAKESYIVEQDYSSRGFWEVAKALGSSIKIYPFKSITTQGDAIVRNIIKNNEKILDLRHAPDTAPIMSIYFAVKTGILANTQRLKFKESDRLQAIIDFLTTMNVKHKLVGDTLEIFASEIKGGQFDTHNDHRILMALVIASTVSAGDICVKELKSYQKSYFNFINDFESLGGVIDEK